ncbi:MAG: hypothetical protein EB832_02550 [Thaumarchaeota archaeon S14]|nr:MAG: hypothetical protein EB832_02550 [Thaumarchaeota archaeon S14]
MAAQAGLKADSPLDRAVSETKRYAARIDETLNDPNVCDMAVKMQADVKFLDTRYPPREY